MRLRHLKSILGALAVGALLAAPVTAQNPYMRADDSWINIEGTVDRVWRDAFTLDYGDGTVTVEMDDGDRDADAYILRKGDKVSVSGRVDDDLFEITTIEAGRVYVENLGTNFYSSAADEEDWLVSINPPLELSRTEIRGTVIGVDETDDSFTLRVGARDVTIETDELSYDPLDDEGYQQIEAGDYVAVGTHLEQNFFEGHEIMADHVTVLYDETVS
ncbi:MAG: hypothetical protein PVJ80_08315 [Gemmatimonadota bacterium]|jgi:uncharacterized protein YdeI (BOF family)